MHRSYEDAQEIVFDLCVRWPDNQRMIRTILSSFRLRSAAEAGAAVHFHQGPQGQPVPCFDTGCPNPRLTV